MTSLQPCGACNSLKVEDILTEIFAKLKDGHSTGLRDDQEDVEESPQQPWHPVLLAVLESSKRCVLCQLVLQGLRESRRQVVEDTRFSGEWPETPKDFDDDILTIPYYSNAAPKVTIVAWPFNKFERDNSLISSNGNEILKAHAIIRITCSGGIPTTSSWDGYKEISCELRISCINGTFDTGVEIERTPQNDPASDSVFHLLKFWISTCESRHERCNKDLTGPKHLPTRILNISSPDGKIVYLEESDTISSIDQPYAALSHCWGSSQPFTTTIETLKERKHGSNIADLPQTYQDAITVARALGLQFLWIDSLCIIQNDMKDWEQEAAKMATVYRDASIVIGASNSSADSEGFLHERQLESALISHKLHAALLPPNPQRLTAESEPLDKEPLNSRAWTLQERYLPRRMISYGKCNVFWECSEMIASEDGYCVPRDGDRLAQVTKTAAIELSVCGISGRPPGDTADTNYFDWYQTVKEYKQRNITKSMDRLPALAGLAKAISEVNGDKYLAGIWRKGLIEGLLWCKAKDQELTKPEYRAPSWSWASVDGLVNFTVYHYYDRCTWKYMMANFEFTAIYADSFLEPTGENIFGALKDGWISLKAPLLPITSTRSWENVDYRPPGMIMDPLRSAACDRVFEIKLPRNMKYEKVWLDGGFDIDENLSSEANLFALLLARLPYPDSSRDRYLDIRFGLILEATKFKDEYKRVGIIDGSVKSHRSSMLSRLQGLLYLETALYSTPKQEGEDKIPNLLGPDPYEGLEHQLVKIV